MQKPTNKQLLQILSLLLVGMTLGWVLSLCRFGILPRFGGPHHDGPFSELNLTPDQKEKIAVLRKERGPEKELVREKVDMAQKEFEAAFQTSKTEEELRSIHDKLLEARADMDRTRLEMLLKVRTILTPEQRKELRLPGPPHHGGKNGPRGKHGR